jgi:hypothetical protein
LVRFSITASFIVIAALTRMRLSEILSIEENCLERLPPEDGSDECLLYVRGVLVKTAGTPSGVCRLDPHEGFRVGIVGRQVQTDGVLAVDEHAGA